MSARTVEAVDVVAAVLSAAVVGAAPGDVADSVAVLEARHTALLATAVVESIVTVVFAALVTSGAARWRPLDDSTSSVCFAEPVSSLVLLISWQRGKPCGLSLDSSHFSVASLSEHTATVQPFTPS